VRPRIWLSDSVPGAELERLAALADVQVYPTEGPLARVNGQADLLIANAPLARVLEVARALDGLRVIQTMSAGVDRYVGQVPSGVTLCDAGGVHDVAVAEWVLMAILAAQRNLPIYLAAQEQARWRMDRIAGRDLVDATVLIVGAGSIGRAVEARLVPFGARIERIARTERPGIHPLSELGSLLPQADVVVVLLPLTAETRGTFDVARIGAMRTGALLVNASRGPIVDTAALTEAVLAGRIRTALDVTDPEPLPDGHPLWSAPGALITPHVASDVAREDERGWQLVYEQVERLAAGAPPVNIVADGY
jgi:phosphoglycerate dehydrogenase-like enzyme